MNHLEFSCSKGAEGLRRPQRILGFRKVLCRVGKGNRIPVRVFGKRSMPNDIFDSGDCLSSRRIDHSGSFFFNGERHNLLLSIS
jgi:hypothetical protein